MANCEWLFHKKLHCQQHIISATLAFNQNTNELVFFVSQEYQEIISLYNFLSLWLVNDHRSQSFTMITFPPGTYTYIYRRSGKEVDPATGLNAWLEGQACPSGCRFHVTGKRPSKIKEHFAQCRWRADTDPTKMLCRLLRGWHQSFLWERYVEFFQDQEDKCSFKTGVISFFR
jgi:hypothetical protein